MVELYKGLVSKYDIIFIEDPLSEDDWAGFAQITSEMGKAYEVPGGRHWLLRSVPLGQRSAASKHA